MEQLEEQRQAAAKKMYAVKRSGIFTYIVTLLYIAANFAVMPRLLPILESYVGGNLILLPLIGGYVALGILIWRSLVCYSRGKVAYDDYNTFVKEAIVRDVLSETVTVNKYQPNNRFFEKTIEESGLFRFVYYVFGNDLIEAVYRDRRFLMCDLSFLEGDGHTKSLGPRSKFTGRFMILQSEDFCDPGDSDRIITDHFMRITENHCDRIDVSSSGGKVYIAWHCGIDLFEADEGAKATLAEEKERFTAEFRAVTDFLDCLPEKAMF
ncbi:MAG: hypothetical protein LBL87_08485 [Ruminococcus sp.]|jgi:hypothetical protein|nr:hypothetical protein [Ruminococcus sp.]